MAATLLEGPGVISRKNAHNSDNIVIFMSHLGISRYLITVFGAFSMASTVGQYLDHSADIPTKFPGSFFSSKIIDRKKSP